MVKAKVFILQKSFEGFPQLENFKIIEEVLPPLKQGEFLAEAVFVSVDPYMRLFASNFTVGETFVGQQVALIKESKNPDFPVGKYVVGNFGWRTHTVTTGKTDMVPPFPTLVLPDFGGLPLSLALGILGMPGNTGYFGFLEICHPKAGETVVVSGAAGAVGSVVGQIAKIKGCKVIGIAGSDEKLKWLTKDLGFDGAINYKTQDVEAELKKLAPEGVDCYFDNVGGEITAIVLNQMNEYGRVSICGVISGYNDKNAKSPLIEMPILLKQLRVEGFFYSRWNDHRWMEGILQLLKWVQEGKIKYNETVTKGFENLSRAFIGMLQGQNTGKAIVKV